MPRVKKTPAAKKRRMSSSRAIIPLNSTALQSYINRLPLTAFPRTNVVRMRFAHRTSLQQTTADTAVMLSVLANGIHDPLYNGASRLTGNSALGHDQWSTFYEGGVVLSSTINAVIQSQGNAGAQSPGSVITLRVADVNDGDTQIQNNIERGLVSWTTLNPSELSPVILKSSYNGKRWLSTNNVRNQSGQVFNFSGDPGNPVYFVMALGSMNAGQVSGFQPFDIVIQVDYVVQLLEKQKLPSSA